MMKNVSQIEFTLNLLSKRSKEVLKDLGQKQILTAKEKVDYCYALDDVKFYNNLIKQYC